MPDKLTGNNKHIFWKRVELGKTYTYSMEFMLNNIQKMAKENEFVIRYNIPGTPLYKKYGSLNFTIVSKLKNEYHGITHGIKLKLDDDKYCELFKKYFCSKGIHAFDEVWSIENHYLHCDICGLEVHINKIVKPEEENENGIQ